MNRFPSRNKNEQQLIIGLRPLEEAINSGKSIDKIFIQKGIKGDTFQGLMEMIKDHRISYQIVPIEKLNRLTRKNHQGVVAFTSPIEFKNLEEILARIWESGTTPRLLMLDRISDVRNFGAISRSAECFGFQAVIVPFKGAAAISEDAVKTSAGALLKLDVCKVNDLNYTTTFLKDSGIEIVGITEKASEDIRSIKFDKPLCLVLGSEEDGISPDLLNL